MGELHFLSDTLFVVFEMLMSEKSKDVLILRETNKTPEPTKTHLPTQGFQRVLSRAWLP